MNRLYLIIIPVLLQSCSSMYIPASRSIPLLEKQGEFQMEAGASTNSVYANVSGAMTDDIAFTINGNMSYRNFTDYYDLTTYKDAEAPTGYFKLDFRGEFVHRYGEISVGKINMLPDFPMKLELFGGAGIGRATDFVDYYSNSYGNYEADYYSIFGQGNFGLKKRKIEAGVSTRLAYSMFNYTSDYKNLYGEQYLFQDKFGAMSFEPILFVRFGGDNLKTVFRIGLNLMLPRNLDKQDGVHYGRGFNDYGDWKYTIFNFSVGLSYRTGGTETKRTNNRKVKYHEFYRR